MKFKYLAGALAALAINGQANASDVAIYGTPINSYVQTNINHFYSNVATSSTIISSLDSSSLSEIELLWLLQPSSPYSSTQLSTLASFLSGGGRIAFLGEHGGFAPIQNNNITSALSSLGAHISINLDFPDGGYHTASVNNGQILPHSLTTGVNLYEYACFASLNVSGPAQILMTGTDHSQVMMAYENIGPGSVFLITDQNVWDHEPSGWEGFNNGKMFENLLLADTGAPPVNGVPEPATALLAGLGLFGLASLRRRK